jgi:ABC-type sugar transport system ATPase subunit
MVKADRGCSGSLMLEGRTLEVSGPGDSRRVGIAFIPEDRKAQGLVLGLPAYANIALTSSGDLNGVGPLTSRRKQVAVARETTQALAVRTTDVTLKARQFSGGNQQKLVIAKWMWRDSSVYLFDEPTKGVDVGGRFEIYTLIDQLAGSGKAVVVVSSELPELITLCDRVVVIRDGQLTTSHEGADINEHALVASAMGQPEA